MSEKDVDKIEPVDFDLNEGLLFPNKSVVVNTNQPPVWIWIGLALLIVVALVVVFVLPAVVTEYDTFLTGLNNESIAISPNGGSSGLFNSAGAYPLPVETFISI